MWVIGPVGGIVDRDVGVQQQDRHAADLCHPHRRMDRPAGDLDAHDQRLAVRAARASQRQLPGIQVRLRVLLVPVGVDLLAEVAAPVEEADGDEGQRRIGRRLAVVAGQDAEAAGVDLHRLVDAELGAEVGDRSGELALR